MDSLSEKTRNLQPLSVGDVCRVQNQTGHHPTKWDRTGVVVQAYSNDQYLVKVHGSGRITSRNRKFLRKIQPLISEKQTTSHRFIPAASPASAPSSEQAANPVASQIPVELSDNLPNNNTPPTPLVQPAPSTESTTDYPAGSHCTTTSTSESTGDPTDGPVTTTPTSRPPRSRRRPLWHADYEM